MANHIFAGPYGPVFAQPDDVTFRLSFADDRGVTAGVAADHFARTRLNEAAAHAGIVA